MCSKSIFGNSFKPLYVRRVEPKLKGNPYLNPCVYIKASVDILIRMVTEVIKMTRFIGSDVKICVDLRRTGLHSGQIRWVTLTKLGI